MSLIFGTVEIPDDLSIDILAHFDVPPDTTRDKVYGLRRKIKDTNRKKGTKQLKKRRKASLIIAKSIRYWVDMGSAREREF
uniref:Uncharacterized protein n=1 Tax=Solanum tuberosum TaxID=4113 RepID=M1DV92_SOLTU